MPRVNAKAKDSEWVRQRKAWEKDKPADVNEVLLVTPDGHVLEGLTSNFFVLGADVAVHTADEGVLSGTVRELILEVGALCAGYCMFVRRWWWRHWLLQSGFLYPSGCMPG